VVLKSTELSKRWETLGVIPLGGTPEDAARRNEVEVQRWSAVIEAAKIQVE